MESFPKLDDVQKSSPQVGVCAENKDREVRAVRSLLKKQGVSFGTSFRLSKADNPLQHLLRGHQVPSELRVLVLHSDAMLGIRAWGHADFLVHHCGYTLEDRRK